MAPSLKDVEVPVATATNPSHAVPQSKPPAEAPTRSQPVALEIPVTVNGAHTVSGSDKREPFSETTNTVLVFPLGAVIRINTPLTPGQLVFLTNEKSKKEVVCQVLKSKDAGSAGAYVELQFTEPSPNFWGLQVPGAPAAPLAPRAATPAPAPPKVIAPPSPISAAPVASKPVAPAATLTVPAKPSMAPPPPAQKPEPVPSPSIEPENSRPQISVVVPPPPTPPVAAAPEPPAAQSIVPIATTDARPQSTQAEASAPPRPAAPVIPLAPAASNSNVLAPPLHDYSKAIEALFAPLTPAPPASLPASVPPGQVKAEDSATPSTEELKLHAARLQEQLSSLLFTEASSTPPAPPARAKLDIPVAEVTNKILEIAQEEPKPIVKSEPRPAPPAPKTLPTAFSGEDEVKVPAWLAPLSQETQRGASGDNSGELPSTDGLKSTGSNEASDLQASSRPITAIFGGQLLGESAAAPSQSAVSGSKKGLFFAIAAVVLLAVGGAWYFRQSFLGSPPVSTVKPASTPAAVPAAPTPRAPAAVTGASAPTTVDRVSSVPASSPSSLQPAKPAAPTVVPAVPVAAPEPKRVDIAPKSTVPVQPEKKSAVGEVHLAAPVINRGASTQDSNDALPSVESNSSGEEALAVVSVSRNQPVAPVPVGGDVKLAQVLKSVAPLYPPMAKSQHISGNVEVDVLIEADGHVAAVKAISGPPLLRSAAVDAVKQWKFAPATLDGQPTATHLTVTVQFKVQ